MNYFFKFLSFSIVIFCLNSCAGYKSKLQTAALTFPELGSIVKTKGELWYASSKQVGVLDYESPILVTAQELPFNRATYRKYANFLEQASRINSIPYSDSLPYKPKYIRLQILDQITLTALLNNDSNTAVRSYLENDSDYKLITTLDVTVTDELRPLLLEAESMLLQNNAFNKLSLVIKNKNQKQVLDLSHLEVFDYTYVSFCWGEDKYHAKRIKALVQGNESCPKDTYAKASKVKSNHQSYLKL